MPAIRDRHWSAAGDADGRDHRRHHLGYHAACQLTLAFPRSYCAIVTYQCPIQARRIGKTVRKKEALPLIRANSDKSVQYHQGGLA